MTSPSQRGGRTASRPLRFQIGTKLCLPTLSLPNAVLAMVAHGEGGLQRPRPVGGFDLDDFRAHVGEHAGARLPQSWSENQAREGRQNSLSNSLILFVMAIVTHSLGNRPVPASLPGGGRDPKLRGLQGAFLRKAPDHGGRIIVAIGTHFLLTFGQAYRRGLC